MSPTEALDALFRENELPMSDRNGVLYDTIRAALAEAESAGAEPVAWQQRTYSDEDRAWSDWLHIDNESLSIRRRYPDPRVELRPLYTHPPAREADLGDEEIIAIRDEHLPAQGEPFDCIAFARRVRAARGKG